MIPESAGKPWKTRAENVLSPSHFWGDSINDCEPQPTRTTLEHGGIFECPTTSNHHQQTNVYFAVLEIIADLEVITGMNMHESLI